MTRINIFAKLAFLHKYEKIISLVNYRTFQHPTMRSRREQKDYGTFMGWSVVVLSLVAVLILIFTMYGLPQKDSGDTIGQDWDGETDKLLQKTDSILRKIRRDLKRERDSEPEREDNDQQESNKNEDNSEAEEKQDPSPQHTDAKFAYVAVVSLESYIDGAIVMGLSLRNLSSLVQKGSCKLVCIVVNTLSEESKKRLDTAGWIVKEVEPLHVHVPKAHWADSFDKLYVFGLTQFKRVVLVDSDMLTVADSDAIFDTKLKNASYIGAIGNNPKHHKGPYFQSGMLVIIPSRKVYNDLFTMLLSESAPKKPNGIYNKLNARDGSLLRTYFVDRYTTISNSYSKHLAPWEPLFATKIRMLHFRGSFKPWYSPEAMYESKPDELAFGPGYRLWWEYYEEFHRKEMKNWEDGATWGINGDKNPSDFVWMLRNTKKEYMRKLTKTRFTESNFTKVGILLVKGNLGESCDTACKHHGKSHKWCDEESLSFTPLSDCSLLKRAFSCTHCMYADYRKDFPASEAPSFVTEKDVCLRNYQLDPRTKPTCGDKHDDSRRLCPCYEKGDIDNSPTVWSGEDFEIINLN